MTDSNQQAKLENYIKEIIAACKDDSVKLEVAISNFQALANAMKQYERAPRYFNAAFEEGEAQPNQIRMKVGRIETDSQSFPVVYEIEKIYGRKLKQIELQQLANQISNKIGLKIGRNVKRSKVLLLQWFSTNWATIHPKIYEYNFNQMTFGDGKV